jgi:phage shock protein PspC (stress-responsive transcriptional regulator)
MADMVVAHPNKESPMNATTSPPPAPASASLTSARAWFAANGLTRPREKRMLGGVCTALARRYGVDRFVMRLAMVAGVIALTPLVYVALWVLMPSES